MSRFFNPGSSEDDCSDDYSEVDAVVIGRDDVSNYNPENILPETSANIDKIRAWLNPTQYDIAGSEYRKHLASRVDGTGSWLTKSGTYQQWLHGEDHGLLWVKGIPGSGKSVHAAKLIHDLGHANPGCPVLFFFFRQIIVANHKPQALLRDWMHQLLGYSPPLQQQLLSYVKRGTSLDSLSTASLLKDLKEAFRALPNKVFCVVDALDEMDSGNDAFLEELSALGQWQPSHTKVIITSRPVPKVEGPLRRTKCLSMRLEEDLVDVDISTYVRTALTHSSIPRQQWQVIVDAVPGRANGLFLYARLAMNAFLEEGADIDAVLLHLPADLNVLYSRLIEEHRQRSGIPAPIQHLILQSVTHATRPLRLLELAELIRVLSPDGNIRDLKATKNLVREACGPLLEILADETVSVIHHSFTEYLKGSTRMDHEIGYPVLQQGPTHAQLASACLRYLLSTQCLVQVDRDAKSDESGRDASAHRERPLDPPTMTELRIKFPFIEYATRNWHAHIRVSETESVPQDELNGLLAQFFEAEEAWRTWLRLNWTGDREDRGNFTVLHIAAKVGLVSYTHQLLQLSEDGKDATDIQGRTPIWWAASQGHATTTKELIAAGANPNQPDKYNGLRPLHRAASKNHAGVVKVLLGAGVNPMTPKSREDPGRRCGNARRTVGDTALMFACDNGHVEAVEEFLPFLDLDAAHEALAWAAKGGHARAVSAILRYPTIEVDSDTQGSTALYYACEVHSLATVEVLLEAGADPEGFEETDPKMLWSMETQTWVKLARRTPLSALCSPRYRSCAEKSKGSEASIFRLLVSAGVDVNRRAYLQRTPLHDTAKWSLALTRLLLDEGASVDAADSSGLTALHESGSAEILDVLVEHGGADMEKTNASGETPLLNALSVNRHGSGKKVLRLLELGANAQGVNLKGDSALHILLQAGDNSPELVRALLDSGADANRRNRSGKTPLMLLRSVKGEIEELLLGAGADINAQDHEGKTVLFQIISGRNWQSSRGPPHHDLQNLVDRGARTDSRDHKGRTCLHEAIKVWEKPGRYSDCKEYPQTSRFDFLLDLGNDPSSVDYKGNSLLHELARHSQVHSSRSHQIEFWRRLVDDHGLKFDQTNHAGRTPLHILCDRDETYELKERHAKDFAIDFAIEKATNVDTQDHSGVTALHLAAMRNEPIVKKLLEAGADPLATTHKGMNALHMAARSQKLNILGLLLATLLAMPKAAAQNPNMEKETTTPAGQGDGPIATITQVLGVNSMDNDNRTPLYYAVRSGRPEAVALLLDAGADAKKAVRACLDFEAEYAFLHAPSLKDVRGLTDHETKLDSKYRLRNPSDVTRYQDLEHYTPRLYEILNMLLSNGATYLGFLRDPDHPHKASFVTDAVRSGSPSSLMNSGYTAACLASLFAPDVAEKFEKLMRNFGVNLATVAYNSHVLRKPVRFPPMREGEDNRSWFLTFMKQRQYDLVVEMSKKGVPFLPRKGANSTPHMTSLVRHGFTSLVDTIGDIECAKALRTGTWHAFGEKSEPGMWFADRISSDGEGIDTSRTPCPLLLDAVNREEPNLAMMKLLVEKFKVDPNEGRLTCERTQVLAGDTPLHFVARGERWWHVHEALPYLLSLSNININERVQWQEYTALHFALSPGGSNLPRVPGIYSLDAALMLVKAGTDVNATTKAGLTPLALAKDNLEMAKLLLQHGAVGQPIDILAAVESGNVEVLKAMLSTGVDPDIPYRSPEHTIDNPKYVPKYDQMIPLRAASQICTKNTAQILQTLLDHGADPFSTFSVLCSRHSTAKEYLFVAEAQARPTIDLPEGCREVTTMHEIAIHGGCEYLPIFLDAGIDLNRRDAYGLTVFHALCRHGVALHDPWATVAPKCESGNGETVFEHLLSRGADLKARDYFGRNILMAILSRSRGAQFPEKWQATLDTVVKLAAELLEQSDMNGDTPLLYAVRSLFTGSADTANEVIHQLLEVGASPTCTNKAGDNALHIMARDLTPKRQPVFRDLVSRGVDINARNAKSRTPLFVFARRAKRWQRDRNWDPEDEMQYPEKNAINLFQELGAEFSVKDSKGRGLLHVAAEGWEQRFKELMAKGLDPKMEDDAQQTAIDMAAASSNTAVLEIFEKNPKKKRRGRRALEHALEEW